MNKNKKNKQEQEQQVNNTSRQPLMIEELMNIVHDTDRDKDKDKRDNSKDNNMRNRIMNQQQHQHQHQPQHEQQKHNKYRHINPYNLHLSHSHQSPHPQPSHTRSAPRDWLSHQQSHSLYNKTYSLSPSILLNPPQQPLTPTHKSKLLQQIQQRRLNSLYQRIQDKSYIINTHHLHLYHNYQTKYYKRILNYMDSKISTFSPQSPWLLLWNFIIAIVILFNLFQIPIVLFLGQSVYYSQINSKLGLTINIVFLFLLYIDTLFIRISISYYHKGKQIQSRISIFATHLPLQLWLNLFSLLALSIYIIGSSPWLIYIKILFYLRIYSLYKIDQQIFHVLQFRRIPYAIYRITRLIILLWYITSLAASIYFAIDYTYYKQQGQYYNNGMLWLTNTYAVGNLNLIQNYNWFIWYSYALYWSIQTSSTVGYGDITPMNPVEVFYVIIVILVMTILWAFYVNTIWKIIGQLQDGVVQYGENWKKLIGYFRGGGSQIGMDVKQKVSNYMYYKWKDSQNYQIQEDIINKKISKQLRDLFYVQYRHGFFDGVPLFKALSCQAMDIKDAMRDLVYEVEEITVSEGDHVYEENVYDGYLYYLKKGDVLLSIKGSSIKIKVKENMNFGNQGFFRRKVRNHTARALVFCKIWRLSYVNLRKVLKKYQYLNQQFNQLESRILLDKSPLFLNIACWKCKSKFHFMDQCPQINSWQDQLSVNHTNVASYGRIQFQRYNSQDRQVYTRQNAKAFKCYGNYMRGKIWNDIDQQDVARFDYYFPEHNIVS